MRHVLIAIILAGLVATASAQTLDPGMITPKHGILYWLDLFKDELVIAFSPNKAQALMSVLNERLAEIQQCLDCDLVQEAIKDYEKKMLRLRYMINTSDEETKQIVSQALEIHNQVLQQVKDLVPATAKPAIERSINVSMKAKDVCDKALSQLPQQTYKGGKCNGQGAKSYISAPSVVRVGETVTLKLVLYNPYDTPVKNPVATIEVKKDGWFGWFFQKSYTTVLDITIPAKGTYTREETVTVPESAFGIPLTGKWHVHVKITGNGKVLLEETRTVMVVE